MDSIFKTKKVLDAQELLKQLAAIGITQSHVSRETGISHYTLRNIKNGKTKFLLPSTERALINFWRKLNGKGEIRENPKN
jgi:hypothetical protein